MPKVVQNREQTGLAVMTSMGLLCSETEITKGFKEK